MRELTEREEQEMIDRAKAGDPQANYELSLWALQRAEEEPGEVRWNKLAAKCLVKSAQAGYGPAQKRMEALLLQQKEEEQAAAGAKPAARPEPRPLRSPDAAARAPQARQQPARREAPVRTRRPAPAEERTAPARRTRERPAPEEQDEDTPARTARRTARPGARDAGEARETREARPRAKSGGKGGIGGLFANWGDAQWRMMEIVCIAVCVVLAIVLAVMLLTGNKGDGGSGDGFVPSANVAGGDAGAGTVQAAAYPDEATKSSIQAAQLDQYPDEADYVTAPLTATVSVTENLRLRTGPNSTFDVVDQMPNATQVEIFAKRSGWDLVRYNSSVWGWCSAEYLIEDASGTAPAPDAGTVPAPDPNAAG